MIKIKEIDPKFANADAETRRQMWEINVGEALKQAVSMEELKLKVDRREFDNALTQLSKEVSGLFEKIKELEKPKSSLEIKIEDKPKVKNPSLLEDIIKAIKNHKK